MLYKRLLAIVDKVRVVGQVTSDYGEGDTFVGLADLYRKIGRDGEAKSLEDRGAVIAVMKRYGAER